MAAEVAALDAATGILEGLAAAGAFDERPNPDAVESAACSAMLAYLAEDSGGAVPEGAEERAMDF
eukprot:11116280-Alexandrium_andersonii.AAC.1